MGKITEFDASKHLDSEEMIAEYLNQTLAKARSMAQIARIGR
jgi:DNA-binding phage protein